MSTYLSYDPDGPKQTLADQIAAACDVLWEKHGVRAQEVIIPDNVTYDGPYRVTTRRQGRVDRIVLVGPLGE